MAEYSPQLTLPNRETAPHSEFDHEGQLKIVIAGLDQNVRTQAIEAANDRLNEELGEGGFTKKLLKGIWKGNVAREFYLTKYTQQAEKQIFEHENLLHHHDVSAEEYQTATTMRFAHEYDELIHEEAGERRQKILDQNEDGSVNEEGYELKQHIFRLIEDYAAGNFSTDADFQEAKKRMMTEMVERGLTKDHIGEGLLYTDNLLQIAQNVKAKIEHRQAMGEEGGIDDILGKTDLILGEAKLGARTGVELTKTERIMKKLEGKTFLNDSVVATAASITYSVASWATTTAAGAAGGLVAVAGAAGGWAALREKRMLKEERAQHARDMAVGVSSAEDLKGRRKALEETRYETKTAQELMGGLGALYSNEGELQISGKDEFESVLQTVAEIQARIELSDEKSVDLISFSQVGEVEKERFDLDLTLAKAKCDLRALLESADDDTLVSLGIARDDIPGLRNGERDIDILDFVLMPRVEGIEGVVPGEKTRLLEGEEGYEGIAQKDRIYRKLRNKRMMNAALKGTALSLVIGVQFQEAIALADNGQQGAIEAMFGVHDSDAARETLMQGLIAHDTPIEVSGDYSSVELEDGTKFMLPEEFSLEVSDQGQAIIGPDGMRVEGINLSEGGVLSEESELALRQAGFDLGSTETYFTSTEVLKEEVVSAEMFVDNHQDITTDVTRDFWYDNGTTNIYEGSELGLQYPTVDGDGNVVLSISNMDSSATSSTGAEMSWREAAADGDLQIAVSASEGTQSEVFMVAIDENGQATIPQDSPVASMFSVHEGHVNFDGKFTEVVEVAGVDDEGVTHIRPLATDVGEGLRTFTDTIATKEPEAHNIYTLEYTPQKETLISIPPVLPWYPRRGIGRLVRSRGELIEEVGEPQLATSITPDYLSSYFNATPEQLEEYRSRMSPRLREGDNPDIELNEREELEWYWGQLDGDQQEVTTRHAETIGSVGENVDIAVAIPVAGHQEMDTIYNTLSAYLDQTMDRDRYEIVLYVNHPETDQNGNPTYAEETLAEIQRFQNDYPGMNVKVIYDKLTRDKANISYIRKVLSDTMVRRTLDRTNNATGEDLIVVSNDADTIRVSNQYLDNFVSRFRQSPDIDAMLGQLDWDNEAYIKYPEIHVATRLFLYESIMKRRAGGGIETSGANFTYHLKNYAAVGGYKPGITVAEDVDLGYRFKAARSGAARKKAIGYGGNVQSRLETSARRAIYTFETFDDAPYNQWNYSFSADDDDVRRLTVSKEERDMTDSNVRGEVMRSTENLINRTIRSMGLTSASSVSTVADTDRKREFISRSIRLCGIQFQWNDDQSAIRITDASDMFEGLEKFKQRMPRLQTAA